MAVVWRVAVLLALCALGPALVQGARRTTTLYDGDLPPPVIEMDEAGIMAAHHTNLYRFRNGNPQSTYVMIRRGFSFNVTVDLHFDLGKDMVLDLCNNDQFLYRNRRPNTCWSADESHGRTHVFIINLRANTPIMTFRFTAYVVEKQGFNQKLRASSQYSKRITVLFNPWHPDDDVYLADEKWREETVLNEKGAVFTGEGGHSFGPMFWAHDHFNMVIFEAVMRLLNSAENVDRSSVIAVARFLASQMHGGVLEGKWKPPYPDGVVPWEQKSSVEIISKYVANMQTSSKTEQAARYGQCMVFAALTTSVYRTLGIPARAVSVFDFLTTPGSDFEAAIYWDWDAANKGYKLNEQKSTDKAWGFHAVTETWMRRADINRPEPSWQIMDGTWFAGPADRHFLRLNETTAQYDLKKYSQAINSRVDYMNQDPADPTVYQRIPNRHRLGTRVITKSWDENCPVAKAKDTGMYTNLCFFDIVDEYKPTTTTTTLLQLAGENMAAGINGRSSQHGGGTPVGAEEEDAHGAEKTTVGPLTVTTFVPKSKKVGHAFTVRMTVKPNEGAVITSMGISAQLMHYYGESASGIFKAANSPSPSSPSSSPAAGGVHTVSLEITEADYQALRATGALRTTDLMHFVFHVEYSNSPTTTTDPTTADPTKKHVHVDRRYYRMRPPRLNMLCGRKQLHVGNIVSCNIQVTNPLPWEIKDAQLRVVVTGEGGRLANFDQIRSLPPRLRTPPSSPPSSSSSPPSPSSRGKNTIIFDNIQLEAVSPGKHWVIALLHNSEIPTIEGIFEFEVAGERAVAPLGQTVAVGSDQGAGSSTSAATEERGQLAARLSLATSARRVRARSSSVDAASPKGQTTASAPDPSSLSPLQQEEAQRAVKAEAGKAEAARARAERNAAQEKRRQAAKAANARQ